jgi:hypothetical protein
VATGASATGPSAMGEIGGAPEEERTERSGPVAGS